MSKFIDKRNLPQYKYFNDMVQQDEDRVELVSDYFTAVHQLQGRNKREYQDGLAYLGRTKSRLPDFLYSSEEDRERCREDLSTRNIKALNKKLGKYIDILLVLHFFQGMPIARKQFLDEKTAESIPESQLRRMYQYDERKKKFYTEFKSVPKLVLVNGNLYEKYLLREFSEKEQERLYGLIAKDVHYIVSVQSDSQSETVYMVGKENQKLSIEVLSKTEYVKREAGAASLPGKEDCTAVLLSLLDYLIEIEKADAVRRKAPDPEGQSYSGKWRRCQKYIDKNSIKVFDMKNADDAEHLEMEVFRFKKKNASLGSARRAGYEMAPHTRKGHYRRYRNGKVVYVRSSIIHKEKYEGIQSAHRINDQ